MSSTGGSKRKMVNIYLALQAAGLISRTLTLINANCLHISSPCSTVSAKPSAFLLAPCRNAFLRHHRSFQGNRGMFNNSNPRHLPFGTLHL
jgi:hypothetical protein